jgi:microcystin-dependent protein
MSEPFVAEIRIFCGNFPPKGWALCNGQLLPISQNTALFSLLGTTYGGDGKSNFALPNLQGAFPMHPGQGPGLTLRNLGEAAGAGTVTLVTSEMPAHTHAPSASADAAASTSPVPGVNGPPVMLAPTSVPVYGALTEPTSLADAAIGPVGGDQPHENHQPYLALNFIIALQGVYPPRS